MTLERFKDIVEKLKNKSDQSQTLYKNGLDLAEYENDLYWVISCLFEEVYGEKVDTLEWWLYEKDYGRREDLKMWDKEGNEICKTVEELYNYLEIKA